IPGAPPRAGTTSPESSASAGNPLAPAAARAFNSAFSSKLAPVSSGSGRPSAAAPIVSTPNGPSSAAISSSLPGLWLAMTSRSPRSRRRAITPAFLFHLFFAVPHHAADPPVPAPPPAPPPPSGGGEGPPRKGGGRGGG